MELYYGIILGNRITQSHYRVLLRNYPYEKDPRYPWTRRVPGAPGPPGAPQAHTWDLLGTLPGRPKEPPG